MESLDPRVNRMKIGGFDGELHKEAMDQLGTYEVFLIPKDGKPLESVGPVHASDAEMAFVFAKEAFSRRFECVAMAVCPTASIFPSPVSEADISAYDLVTIPAETEGENRQYEVFHMNKRGKFHKHVGSVEAIGDIDALYKGKDEYGVDKPKNVWVVPTGDFHFNAEEDSDLWATLPEKKYRDAIFYKAGEKIQRYKESVNS